MTITNFAAGDKCRQHYWKHLGLYPSHSVCPKEIRAELISVLENSCDGGFQDFLREAEQIPKLNDIAFNFQLSHFQVECQRWIVKLREMPENAPDRYWNYLVARIWSQIYCKPRSNKERRGWLSSLI